MENKIRKYIRKEIGLLFEEMNNSMSIDPDVMADTVANYDELKNQQLNQIELMKQKTEKEKMRQKINDDKIKKLKVTFSQVQDTELALIPGGKSEDNKIKKMKQTSYDKERKELTDTVKQTEDQIKQAEKNIQNIENMKKQAVTAQKTAASPSAPSAPMAP
jgi:predicted  nucleic acid-binding Zn-ribbon protein